MATVRLGQSWDCRTGGPLPGVALPGPVLVQTSLFTEGLSKNVITLRPFVQKNRRCSPNQAHSLGRGSVNC